MSEKKSNDMETLTEMLSHARVQHVADHRAAEVRVAGSIFKFDASGMLTGAWGRSEWEE